MNDDKCPSCGSRIARMRKPRGRTNARCTRCPATFRVVSKIVFYKPNRTITVRRVRP